MTKRALLRALMMTCGLLVAYGCKTNTAKDANRKPVVVLEQGMAPHLPLRYAIAEGSTTTSIMELSIPTQTTVTNEGEAFSKAPGLRVVVSTGPAAKLANGNTRVNIKIVSAEATNPEGTDPQVARDYEASARLLSGVGGWIEVDDRGAIQQSELNQAAENPNLPIRLLMTIIQARSSLARVVFPIEPVGVGGRWEARKQVEMFGFQIQQIDRYTLVERVGDELKLSVEIAESAPKQTVEFEEQGMKVKLDSLSVSARGDLVVHFDMLEASGRVEGRATEVLSVKGPDGKESIELDSAFRVDIAVEDATGDAISP
jgi:hypothetical protein